MNNQLRRIFTFIVLSASILVSRSALAGTDACADVADKMGVFKCYAQNFLSLDAPLGENVTMELFNNNKSYRVTVTLASGTKIALTALANTVNAMVVDGNKLSRMLENLFKLESVTVGGVNRTPAPALGSNQTATSWVSGWSEVGGQLILDQTVEIKTKVDGQTTTETKDYIGITGPGGVQPSISVDQIQLRAVAQVLSEYGIAAELTPAKPLLDSQGNLIFTFTMAGLPMQIHMPTADQQTGLFNVVYRGTAVTGVAGDQAVLAMRQAIDAAKASLAGGWAGAQLVVEGVEFTEVCTQAEPPVCSFNGIKATVSAQDGTGATLARAVYLAEGLGGPSIQVAPDQFQIGVRTLTASELQLMIGAGDGQAYTIRFMEEGRIAEVVVGGRATHTLVFGGSSGIGTFARTDVLPMSAADYAAARDRLAADIGSVMGLQANGITAHLAVSDPAVVNPDGTITLSTRITPTQSAHDIAELEYVFSVTWDPRAGQWLSSGIVTMDHGRQIGRFISPLDRSLFDRTAQLLADRDVTAGTLGVGDLINAMTLVRTGDVPTVIVRNAGDDIAFKFNYTSAGLLTSVEAHGLDRSVLIGSDDRSDAFNEIDAEARFTVINYYDAGGHKTGESIQDPEGWELVVRSYFTDSDQILQEDKHLYQTLIESKTWNSDGVLERHMWMDAAGTHVETWGLDGEGRETRHETTLHNGTNILAEIVATSYAGDGSVSSRVFSTEVRDLSNRVLSESRRVVDANGLEVERSQTTYDPATHDASRVDRSVFTHDGDGRVILEVITVEDGAGTILSSQEIADVHGTSLSPQIRLRQRTHTTRDGGNAVTGTVITAYNYNMAGDRIQTTVRKIDARGLDVEHILTEYDPATQTVNKVYRNVYTYDSGRNLTLQVITIEDGRGAVSRLEKVFYSEWTVGGLTFSTVQSQTFDTNDHMLTDHVLYEQRNQQDVVTMSWTSDSTFDGDGHELTNVFEQKFFDRDHNQTSAERQEVTYGLNSDGEVVMQKSLVFQYGAADELTGTQQSDFDAEGRPTGWRIQDGRGNPTLIRTTTYPTMDGVEHALEVSETYEVLADGSGSILKDVTLRADNGSAQSFRGKAIEALVLMGADLHPDWDDLLQTATVENVNGQPNFVMSDTGSGEMFRIAMEVRSGRSGYGWRVSMISFNPDPDGRMRLEANRQLQATLNLGAAPTNARYWGFDASGNYLFAFEEHPYLVVAYDPAAQTSSVKILDQDTNSVEYEGVYTGRIGDAPVAAFMADAAARIGAPVSDLTFVGAAPVTDGRLEFHIVFNGMEFTGTIGWDGGDVLIPALDELKERLRAEAVRVLRSTFNAEDVPQAELVKSKDGNFYFRWTSNPDVEVAIAADGGSMAITTMDQDGHTIQTSAAMIDGAAQALRAMTAMDATVHMNGVSSAKLTYVTPYSQPPGVPIRRRIISMTTSYVVVLAAVAVTREGDIEHRYESEVMMPQNTSGPKSAMIRSLTHRVLQHRGDVVEVVSTEIFEFAEVQGLLQGPLIGSVTYKGDVRGDVPPDAEILGRKTFYSTGEFGRVQTSEVYGLDAAAIGIDEGLYGAGTTFKMITAFDETGNKTSETVQDETDGWDVILRTYSADGRREDIYAYQSLMESKTWNAADQMTGHMWREGADTHTEEWIFDDQGREVKHEMTMHNGQEILAEITQTSYSADPPAVTITRTAQTRDLSNQVRSESVNSLTVVYSPGTDTTEVTYSVDSGPAMRVYNLGGQGNIPWESIVDAFNASGFEPDYKGPGDVVIVDPNFDSAWWQYEADRLEAARIEAERVEAERIEAVRLETERMEAERIAAEQAEVARTEAARIEAELAQVEAARIEMERLEAERLEADRLEAERVEAERIAAEQAAMVMAESPVDMSQTHTVIETSGNVTTTKTVQTATGQTLFQSHSYDDSGTGMMGMVDPYYFENMTRDRVVSEDFVNGTTSYWDGSVYSPATGDRRSDLGDGNYRIHNGASYSDHDPSGRVYHTHSSDGYGNSTSTNYALNGSTTSSWSSNGDWSNSETVNGNTISQGESGHGTGTLYRWSRTQDSFGAIIHDEYSYSADTTYYYNTYYTSGYSPYAAGGSYWSNYSYGNYTNYGYNGWNMGYSNQISSYFYDSNNGIVHESTTYTDGSSQTRSIENGVLTEHQYYQPVSWSSAAYVYDGNYYYGDNGASQPLAWKETRTNAAGWITYVAEGYSDGTLVENHYEDVSWSMGYGGMGSNWRTVKTFPDGTVDDYNALAGTHVVTNDLVAKPDADGAGDDTADAGGDPLDVVNTSVGPAAPVEPEADLTQLDLFAARNEGNIGNGESTTDPSLNQPEQDIFQS